MGGGQNSALLQSRKRKVIEDLPYLGGYYDFEIARRNEGIYDVAATLQHTTGLPKDIIASVLWSYLDFRHSFIFTLLNKILLPKGTIRQMPAKLVLFSSQEGAVYMHSSHSKAHSVTYKFHIPLGIVYASYPGPHPLAPIVWPTPRESIEKCAVTTLSPRRTFKGLVKNNGKLTSIFRHKPQLKLAKPKPVEKLGATELQAGSLSSEENQDIPTPRTTSNILLPYEEIEIDKDIDTDTFNLLDRSFIPQSQPDINKTCDVHPYIAFSPDETTAAFVVSEAAPPYDQVLHIFTLEGKGIVE